MDTRGIAKDFMDMVRHAANPSVGALGKGAKAEGPGSIAVGDHAMAKGEGALAVGTAAEAHGTSTTAVGGESVADGTAATAFGWQSMATGERAHALGHLAEAGGDYSLAAGEGASANYANSSAIGANAEATAANEFVLGNADNFYTLAGLADEVGKGSAEFIVVDDHGRLSSFGLDDLFGRDHPGGDGMMADLQKAMEAPEPDAVPAADPMPVIDFADGGRDLVDDDAPLS